jgi:hypothetical protein
MLAPAQQTQSAEDSKTIVLLLPDALGDMDAATLPEMVHALPATARVLACVTEPPTPTFAAVLGEIGDGAQILLGPELAMPATRAVVSRAPPSTLPQQQIEFAIALSDVALVASPPPQTAVISLLAKLKKPIIKPGDQVPTVPAWGKATRWLDPDRRGWRTWGRRWFGRAEQAMMELLAFAWKGWNGAGLAESAKKLWRYVGIKWRPTAYFPFGWEGYAIDKAALDASAPIVARFEAMDRSASHGSFMHRDLIWITHLGAAAAVAFAVAGRLDEQHWVWGGLEIAALIVVAALVFGARWSDLQERWTACRLGAEQLRIARMSLPLFVLPPALATEDTDPKADPHAKEVRYDRAALVEVKRAVRDQGLPQLDADLAPEKAAAWLNLIVLDQFNYHHDNHHKLERAESTLELVPAGFFALSFVAVLAHLAKFEEPWLLLFTAAGPAFAAAFHGAGIRLGIVHRIALSKDIEQDLEKIDKRLDEIAKPLAPASGASALGAWAEVRSLTTKAAGIMGSENTSWHGLVRRYRDELL